MTTTIHRPPASGGLSRHPHISRLGAGLVVVGGASVAHALWGIGIDLPLLVAGAAGLLWAMMARRATGMVAGTVLLAVALFGLLDDRHVFTGAEDAVTLLVLAALFALAHGLPVARRDVWPIVPAGAMALIAALALIRAATVWTAMPWALTVPLLVALAGLSLLVWDARGGQAP